MNKSTTHQKRNRDLFEEMLRAESLEPTLTFPEALAFAAAILVHSTTVAFILIGIYFVGAAVPGTIRQVERFLMESQPDAFVIQIQYDTTAALTLYQIP